MNLRLPSCVFIVVMLAGCSANQHFAAVTPVHLEPRQVAAVQSSVNALVKDRTTARHTTVVAGSDTNSSKIKVCGVLQLKNGYGEIRKVAYSGILDTASETPSFQIYQFGDHPEKYATIHSTCHKQGLTL